MLLQLPQTPSYPVKMCPSHRQLSQVYLHLPPALHSKH